MREIVLDTETTGLDPKSGHRIIEIGALEMHDKVLTGGKFHFYLNPERDVPQEAYRIHGISSDFLKDKPLFSEIADEFVQFIEGGSLVIHNAAFDMKFINHELTRLGKASIDHFNIVDTLMIARRMFPGSKANLDALCRRFKIDISSRAFHGALKDAKLLSDVYVELCGGRQAVFILQDKKTDEIAVDTTVSAYSGSARPMVVKPTEAELDEHKMLLEKIAAL